MAERERLRQHFLDRDVSTHPNGWEELWVQDFLPWDKGFPGPALSDLLSSPAPGTLPPPQLAPPKDEDLGGVPAGVGPGQRIRRLRALVPGCGKGYDVLLLASHGYDAWGVESAETAVKQAKEEMRGWKEKKEYKVHDERVGRGVAEFKLGDFFEDAWWEEVDREKEGFDLIYDYTVCPASGSLVGSLHFVSCVADRGFPSSSVLCHTRSAHAGQPGWYSSSLLQDA